MNERIYASNSYDTWIGSKIHASPSNNKNEHTKITKRDKEQQQQKQ